MLIKLQSISDVGAQQFIYKEVSMQQIFENSLDIYHEAINQKKIKITVNVKPITSFRSYPAFLKIIVDNLLENSINFSARSSPYIHLSAEEQDNGILIKVDDNGLGIEEEYKHRVFEMFFRGSEYSTGNGLGLYIVKKALDKINGAIILESTFGKGTMVIMRFSKKQED